MNIYDTANNLAAEIRSSNEYKDYKKYKEEINSNPELKNKLKEFEKARYDVQISSMQGQKPDDKQLKNMQEIYIELLTHDVAKKYFDAELKFNVVIADVNRIIGEVVKEVFE